MIVSREHLEARRLARLSSRRHRDQLAQAIDTVLLAASRPAGRTRILPDREALWANSQALGGLAVRLRGTEPLDPEAIASLRRLLSDGTGPIYVGDAQALARQIDQLQQQLAPTGAEPTRAA